MKPFNELKDQLAMAVIGRPDGSITPANWRKVEEALATTYLKIMKENLGHAPICRDGGYHRNHVKLTSCADGKSLILYRKAVK